MLLTIIFTVIYFLTKNISTAYVIMLLSLDIVGVSVLVLMLK